MKEIKEFQDKIASAINELDIEQIIKSACQFNFCCSDLDDNYRTSALESLKKCIDQSLPTIYWLEITSAYPIDLVKEIERLRNGGNFKVPPTNEKDTSNNILYVGKVIKDFRGRVSQHLGYRSSGTWSLQLKHWATNLNPPLTLKLNYIQLNKEINNISLSILEQCIAEELKPILGKHSL